MQNMRNNNRENIHETRESPASQSTEIAGLVKRAAGGDYGAFGDLYSLYVERIYRYAFYQVKDKMTAEDITEEVFIKAWKAINSCKGKEHTFSAWLYRIAHNQVIDIFRNQRKERAVEIETVAALHNPGTDVEIGLAHQELLNNIADLPSNQKQVIVLKFIEGLDNREIERVMGKSQGAIRVLQMRALAELRGKLSSQ